MPMRQTSRRATHKPLILVAEDDPADRALIERALGSQDYAVEIVHDGAEVLEYLEEEPSRRGEQRADLVILDLNMPRMNGIQALQKLRGKFDTRALPVVIFSSSDRRRDIADCYKAGCAAYVVKPTDLEPFNDSLQTIARYWLQLVQRPH